MALAVSPSAAWAYLWGALIMGWGGEAENAIEWGERGHPPKSVRSMDQRSLAWHVSWTLSARTL